MEPLFGYLPEAQNDYIFAVVLEELGLVGGTLIMVLFALLIIRGFWLAIPCPAVPPQVNTIFIDGASFLPRLWRGDLP